MTPSKSNFQVTWLFLTISLYFCCIANSVFSQQKTNQTLGNFGLPGIIDLPSGYRLPDGELVISQQLHRSLARSGISFQALPRLSFAFRYTGHGRGGGEAHGRYNHDRSFDTHISLFDEGQYFPALSIGLRDFIGTGWYSSEYIVGSKTFENLELTMGLGFGRLAGRNSFSNPLKNISKKFEKRSTNSFGKGGTLGTPNWFQGNTSLFYGLNYSIGKKLILSAEYTPDLMLRENFYLDVNSPWNLGAVYNLNKYVDIAAQYLHGNQFSITAHVAVNPGRPPLKGGKELAPVPMRKRNLDSLASTQNNEKVIRKVLAADRFLVHRLQIVQDTIWLDITNVKFRSNPQALGRVTSTLQRFTADKVKIANISFFHQNIRVVSYRVKLDQIAQKQFTPPLMGENHSSFEAIDLPISEIKITKQRFSWGIGPYFAHRLFNPDLPLSMEAGIELESELNLAPGLNISGSIRKSVLTNLTKNKRRSNSVLPRVHSDWPLYDFAGQGGHIHEFVLSYSKNLAPGLYGKLRAGLLEPFFAGIGGEILYKPAKSPLAIGLDISEVQQRDFDMRFDLRDYQTTVGHISFYYDAGGILDVEINAGKYLAGDWGTTTTISRKFGSGWEVGGYATLTDVPFDTFGEGSFDKAIYVSLPIDWIISTPNRSKRRLTLRPITRDGGANLAGARSLYRYIENFQNANFKRESGRIWK